MDKLKYTNGEWALKARGTCIVTDREPICVLCYCEERSEGNAQLIRAAPEMYEAILKMIRYYYNHGPLIPACYTIVELRAIIAKIHKEE